MTFRLSLDSSIFISQLTGDVHAEAVLAALTLLQTMDAELTLPLLCYAELWTGVELLPEADRPAAAETLERILRASRALLVADNVVIAREAARAQAAYRRRGGRREVLIPDFVIGANATYYAGRLLTTNPRDFFKAFATLEVLTPQAFLAQYTPAPPPRERQE
ncbi:MAG TPA: PIN domain-containing protein [Candidatus Tectomicrobia bacterium]